MAEYNSVNLGRIMPKYMGDYSMNVNYNTLDIVFYDGNSYIATQPSLRQTPAIDSEYWGLISSKGDKGDKGDTGAKGAKGDKGDKGDPGKDGKNGNDAQLVHNTGNEVIAGDKTFTGTIYANNRIQGSLATRIANFTDLATVASDMYSYQGIWWFGSGTLLNSPVSSYVLVEVFHGSIKTNGYIRVTSAISGDSYYTNVNKGLSTWNRYATDATVVHNTGNETVAGNKTYVGDSTYMGTNTFMDGVSLNGKNVVNNIKDTDWLDIPLAEGRTGIAKYKVSLGKVFVHLDMVKGITAKGNNAQGQIGTLPVNPNPYYTRHISQASTVRGITITPDGVIYVANAMGSTMSADDSYVLDTVLI